MKIKSVTGTMLKADFLKSTILIFTVSFAAVPLLSRYANPEGTGDTGVFDKYASSIESLASRLRARGFETSHLFTRPEFTIYENIDSFYTKSPEKKSKSLYKEALKSGNKEEAERIFLKEYEEYKAKIGFDHKKKSMAPFLERYGDYLSRSEQAYSIPKEIIAAVIRIESQYGNITGAHYAFNVYVSMYVKNYRTKFALSQLEELLKFAERTKTEIFSFTSSYAGAIGYMQFLPYSLNRWFVGDDVYDMEDTIASVAHYIAHFRDKHGSIESALYKYNPNAFYVKAVQELADYGRNSLSTP